MRAALAAGVVAVCGLLVASCGPSRNSAEDALTQLVEQAEKIAPDAQQFAADDYAAFDAQLNLLRARLTSGDYADVVDAVPVLRGKLDALNARVVEQRAAFAAELARRKSEWIQSAAEIERIGQALETRLTMLARQPTLPENLDRNSFAAIGTDYAKARVEFVRAKGAADAGNYAEAQVRASAAREGFEAVMRDVGLAPALSDPAAN
jgi:hypothetical protein